MFGLFDPRTLDGSARTIQFVQANNGRRHRLTIANSRTALGVASALSRQLRDGMTAIVIGANGRDVADVGLRIFEGVLNNKGSGAVTMDIHGIRVDGKPTRHMLKDIPVVLRDATALPRGRLVVSISGYMSPGGIKVSRLVAEPAIGARPVNVPLPV